MSNSQMREPHQPFFQVFLVHEYSFILRSDSDSQIYKTFSIIFHNEPLIFGMKFFWITPLVAANFVLL